MANVTINQLPVASTIDGVNDYIPIYTASSLATQGINRNTYLGLASSPVGLTDSQTLTNKILTAPSISNPTLSGTVSGTYTLGGTPTFPSSVVTLTGTQTLTNKTLTSPVINAPTITNATISADTLTGFTSTNNGTFYGISVTASKINASALTDASITLPKLGTDASWSYQSWTPTWTNFTTGNGTLNYAKYTQIGKTVFFRLSFTLGSTSSVTGQIIFTTPTTQASDADNNTSYYFDTSAGLFYQMVGQQNSNTSIKLYVFNTTTGTYAFLVPTSATVPVAFGTGDTLSISGSYEAV